MLQCFGCDLYTDSIEDLIIHLRDYHRMERTTNLPVTQDVRFYVICRNCRHVQVHPPYELPEAINANVIRPRPLPPQPIQNAREELENNILPAVISWLQSGAANGIGQNQNNNSGPPPPSNP